MAAARQDDDASGCEGSQDRHGAAGCTRRKDQLKQRDWIAQAVLETAERAFLVVGDDEDTFAGERRDHDPQQSSATTDNGPAQYELLLRMRDRQGNLIQPGSFLYVAERLGLHGDIDRWVTRRAIDTLAKQRALGRDMHFEINLSGRTIGDEALLELIERQLHETAVPPDRLIFEVAETSAVAHVSRAGAFINRLAELGCRFALDDFGAGLGSFYYLKHLPFDYLKIDGEFIANCAQNVTDRTLISAVVQIARDMGKHTIAEWAPDHDTVKILTGLGVDYGQGFHLGRPARLSEHLAASDALAGPMTTDTRRATANGHERDLHTGVRSLAGS